jgi:hypothetical protein
VQRHARVRVDHLDGVLGELHLAEPIHGDAVRGLAELPHAREPQRADAHREHDGHEEGEAQPARDAHRRPIR